MLTALQQIGTLPIRAGESKFPADTGGQDLVMEDRIRSIEAALRKAIEARGAMTPEARQVIYEAAERALARSKIQREADGGSQREQMLRQSLAVATKRIEQSLAGPRLGAPLPEFDLEDEIPMTQSSDMQSPPPERSGGSAKIWLALLLLVVIAAGGAYFYWGQQQVDTLVAASQPDGFVTASPLTLTPAEGFELTPNSTHGYVTVTAVDTPPENTLPVGVTLSDEYGRMFAGKEVTVTVTARSSATDGADSVSIIYYTLGQGNSGWQPQSLTSEFTDISIDYAVPAVVGETGEDYIGISPAVGRSVDIKAVRVFLKQPG